MRLVVDYRPALRARSGVGEYIHQLVGAWAAVYPQDAVTLFTSSWRDRPASDLGTLAGIEVSDHRIPVRLLNLAFHRLEWPTVDLLTGKSFDVALSPHPLLLPATSAAQVVMIHDLDFMRHPERCSREIRRDYPALAAAHAWRANHVIVPSYYTAEDVSLTLAVPADRISICAPGRPQWSSPARGFSLDGYLLFVGTLEPRKNLRKLLAAYQRLVMIRSDAPKLLLAGKDGGEAEFVLNMISRPPLRGRVEYLGYVDDEDRQRLYLGARALVLASHEEGFGMPVLEAMSLGIPVIVGNRGALPDLVGAGGLICDATDSLKVFEALARIVADDDLAECLAARGAARAAAFSWRKTVSAVRAACLRAIHARTQVNRSDARSQTARETGRGAGTTQRAALREHELSERLR
jgi:glycosyltransferase involved in cell wall biosynthesis